MSRSRDQEQGQEAYPGVPEVQDAETWARQRYPDSDQSEVVMKLTNKRLLKKADSEWGGRKKPDESESFMAVFTKELHYVPPVRESSYQPLYFI